MTISCMHLASDLSSRLYLLASTSLFSILPEVIDIGQPVESINHTCRPEQRVYCYCDQKRQRVEPIEKALRRREISAVPLREFCHTIYATNLRYIRILVIVVEWKHQCSLTMIPIELMMST